MHTILVTHILSLVDKLSYLDIGIELRYRFRTPYSEIEILYNYSK